MDNVTTRRESNGLIVDDHAIAYNGELFDRVTGEHSDFLWVSGGGGCIDVKAATAHSLVHPASWEYEFVPGDDKLRSDDGFYSVKISDGASIYETVVEIPAYYTD